MNRVSNRWGVELNGPESDQAVWLAYLKPPFDPYIEKVVNDRNEYFVLRASAFNGMTKSEEVHRAAKPLFVTLNVVMSKNADTDRITNGAVIEFVQDGPPLKHPHLEIEEGITVRARVGIVELTVADAQGNVLKPTPAPSRAQLWMRAATLEPQIGYALGYLQDKADWVNLYKAYEALRNMPNGGISKSEITRFTQTANAGNRHHPNEKNKPHKRPMDLWEARSLMTRWVSAAIDDFLAKNP